MGLSSFAIFPAATSGIKVKAFSNEFGWALHDASAGNYISSMEVNVLIPSLTIYKAPYTSKMHRPGRDTTVKIHRVEAVCKQLYPEDDLNKEPAGRQSQPAHFLLAVCNCTARQLQLYLQPQIFFFGSNFLL